MLRAHPKLLQDIPSITKAAVTLLSLGLEIGVYEVHDTHERYPNVHRFPVSANRRRGGPIRRSFEMAQSRVARA